MCEREGERGEREYGVITGRVWKIIDWLLTPLTLIVAALFIYLLRKGLSDYCDTVIIIWLFLTGKEEREDWVIQACHWFSFSNSTLPKSVPCWLIGGRDWTEAVWRMPSEVWMMWEGAYLPVSHSWEGVWAQNRCGNCKGVKPEYLNFLTKQSCSLQLALGPLVLLGLLLQGVSSAAPTWLTVLWDPRTVDFN